MRLKTEPDLDSYYARGIKQINIAVTPELHTAFKTACLQNEVGMKDVLTDCMIRFVDQYKKEEEV